MVSAVFFQTAFFRYENEVFAKKSKEIQDTGTLFVNVHIAPKCESLRTSNRYFLFELKNIT